MMVAYFKPGMGLLMLASCGLVLSSGTAVSSQHHESSKAKRNGHHLAKTEVLKKSSPENELEISAFPTSEKKFSTGNVKAETGIPAVRDNEGDDEMNLEAELSAYGKKPGPDASAAHRQASLERQQEKEKMEQFSELFLRMMNSLSEDEGKSLSVRMNGKPSKRQYESVKNDIKKRIHDNEVEHESSKESAKASFSHPVAKKRVQHKEAVKRGPHKQLDRQMLRMRRSLIRQAKETSMMGHRRIKRDASYSPEELDAVQRLLEDSNDYYYRNGIEPPYDTEEDEEDFYGRPRRSDPDVEENDDYPGESNPEYPQEEEERPLLSDREVAVLAELAEQEQEAKAYNPDEERGVVVADQGPRQQPIVMFDITFGGQPGFFIPINQELAKDVAEVVEEDRDDSGNDLDELRGLAQMLASRNSLEETPEPFENK